MITADDEWKVLDVFRDIGKPLSGDTLKIKCYNKYRWPIASLKTMKIVEGLVMQKRLLMNPPDFATNPTRTWSLPS